MLDNDAKRWIEKADKVWGYMVPFLEEEKNTLQGGDINILLTIVSRFLNTWKVFPKDVKKALRKEFIDLLDEKLGKK